jgi:hypothetical protein
MKIQITEPQGPVPIHMIDYGGVFSHDSQIYIRLNKSQPEGVCLVTGTVQPFGKDIQVIPHPEAVLWLFGKK